jgi:hypothetical protein
MRDAMGKMLSQQEALDRLSKREADLKVSSLLSALRSLLSALCPLFLANVRML